MAIGLIRAGLAAKIDTLAAEERATRIPNLSLRKVASQSLPIPDVYDPYLAIIVQGKKQVALGRDMYAYDASRFLLASVELPTVSQITEASQHEPYLSLTLKLDLPPIRGMIANLDIAITDTASIGRGITTGLVTTELLCAFSRLVDLIETPRDIPALGGLFAREIFYRILISEQGIRLRQIAMVGTHGNRIAKVIDLLRANFIKPLRIEELAESAHMGVSTLHHNFRTMTAMSPLQYQKQLRLHEARRLMLVEGLSAGAAASHVGYESGSQFNREYRRLFGRSPMRDVKAIRRDTAADA